MSWIKRYKTLKLKISSLKKIRKEDIKVGMRVYGRWDKTGIIIGTIKDIEQDSIHLIGERFYPDESDAEVVNWTCFKLTKYIGANCEVGYLYYLPNIKINLDSFNEVI